MAQSLMRGVADGAGEGFTFENYYAQGSGHHAQRPHRYSHANTNSSNSNNLEVSSTSPDVDLSRVQRCNCCPYGYHIDLDFLNFCDEISSGANLKKLKKPKRSRPRHAAVKHIRPPPPLIPPRSSSLPTKRHRRQKEKLEPEKILAKENAAFWTIYHQFAKLMRKQYMSEDLSLPDVEASFDNLDTQSLPAVPNDFSFSDVETDSVLSLPQGNSTSRERRSSLPGYQVLQDALYSKMDMYNSNMNGSPLSISNLLSMSNHSGSNSSLSSTGSSSVFSPIPHNGSAFSMMDTMMMRPLSSLTSTSSIGDGSTASGRSTPSSVSTNALSAVRQQMAAALLRLKQLEEQVKAIPVLQVKISVLKEEKRLLMLQLKTKSKTRQFRNIGVCDGIVDIDGVVEVNGDCSTPYYELPNTDIVPSSVRSPKPTRPFRPFSPGSPGRAPSPKFGSNGSRSRSPGPASPSLIRRSSSPRPGSPTPTSPKPKTPGPPVSPKPTHYTGKPTAPPIALKKAYVSPVPRPKVETRSVGVDANIIERLKSPEMKSIGINVDIWTEVGRTSNVRINKFQPVKLASVHLRTVRSMASWDNYGNHQEGGRSDDRNGKVAGVENHSSGDVETGGKMLIREGPITAVTANNVSSSPAPPAESYGQHPVTLTSKKISVHTVDSSVNTSVVEQRDCSTEVTPSICDSQTNTLKVQTVESGTCTKGGATESHGFNTDIVLQRDCGTETLYKTSNQSTCTDDVLPVSIFERGTNTDIIQTRIMGTNTKPPVPAKRADASISTDSQMTKTVTRDASVTVRIQPSNMQSTATEMIEMVELGVGTDVKCEDSGVNTVMISTEEKSVSAANSMEGLNNVQLMGGVDAGVGTEVSTAEIGILAAVLNDSIDHATGTDECEVTEVATNTPAVKSVESSTSCEVKVFQDRSTSTEILAMEEMSTNTEVVSVVSSACNTEKQVEYRESCIGDDTSIDDIICCRKVDTHTVSTNTHQRLETRSRTVGAGLCAISDNYCIRCDTIQTRSVSVGGDRVADAATRTRTIGTNHSVLLRTIGVGFDMICDPKSLLGSVTKAVGERDINDVMCNVCDKKPQRTIGTGICIPMRDASIGDGPMVEQTTLGVGQCTVMDRICDRCNGLSTVSIGIGSSDVYRYTHSRSVQVGETSTVSTVISPLSTSPTKFGISSFIADYDSATDSVFREEPAAGTRPTTDLEVVSTEPNTQDIAAASTQAVPSALSTPAPAKMVMEEIKPVVPAEVGQALSPASIDTKPSAAQDQQRSNGIVSPPRSPPIKNGNSLPPCTVSTGSLDYEIHVTMSEPSMLGNGFINPHALLAGGSPRSATGATMLGASIIKRASQDSGTEGHHSETTDTDVGERSTMASSTLSSSSSSEGSDSSETDSDSSNTTSSGDEMSSFDRSLAKRREGGSKKRAQNAKITAGVDEEGAQFEMGAELKQACMTLGKLKEKQGDSNTKDWTSCMTIIAKDWFRITSQKLSDPRQVSGFLTAVSQEVGKAVLERVVNMVDSNGNTALHYSVSHGNFDIVLLLLDTGACQTDRPNRAGYTTIMLASLVPIQNKIHASIVKRLFKEGDINLRASQAGQTALMLAVSKGRLDMVKLLLGAGADVNTQDEDGSTALMCASEHGHLDIVKVLLSHPLCDPHLVDNDGSTAFSIAMEAGHKDIGVLLYAHMNFGKQTSASKKRSSASGSPSPQRHVSTSVSHTPSGHSSSPSRSTSTSSVSTLVSQLSLGGGSTDASSTPGGGSALTQPHPLSTSSSTELLPSQLVRSRSLSPSSRIPSFKALALPRSSQVPVGASGGHHRIATPPGGSPKRFAAILAAQRITSAHSTIVATTSRTVRTSSSGSESPSVSRKVSPSKKATAAQGSSSNTGSRSSPRQTPLQKKGIKPANKYSTV